MQRELEKAENALNTVAEQDLKLVVLRKNLERAADEIEQLESDLRREQKRRMAATAAAARARQQPSSKTEEQSKAAASKLAEQTREVQALKQDVERYKLLNEEKESTIQGLQAAVDELTSLLHSPAQGPMKAAAKVSEIVIPSADEQEDEEEEEEEDEEDDDDDEADARRKNGKKGGGEDDDDEEDEEEDDEEDEEEEEDDEEDDGSTKK
mmetsp:Transcript_4611/g.18374  ORF Transcript_4611/g.18374 Transcript_4611/m.18374 type:complete len:210 (-) Transcript_4611:25-654(-)